MVDEVPCVLVVDDEPEIREILTRILERGGIKVITAEDGHLALEKIHFAFPDAVLLDVHMPGLSGMEVLRKVRETDDDLPVVLLTGYANTHEAVDAVKESAYDYLAKPFEDTEVLRVMRRALLDGRLKKRLKAFAGRSLRTTSLIESMGPSDKVARLAADVHRVAKSDYSVLVIGETGSGKELVAQAIHADSARCQAPFIAIDCGAIPEFLLESELFGHERGSFTGAERLKLGMFELASGGTVFMDEINNLPAGSQAKFLRVLEDGLLHRVGATKPVNVDTRLITASNTDLQDLAMSGGFRRDLFYRLSEFMIYVPPLRERTEDIPYLAKRFLDTANIELKKTLSGFTEGAVQALLSYEWPGNVRQMRSTIRRAALVARDVVSERDLGITPVQQVTPLIHTEGAPREGASLGEIVQQAVLAVEMKVLTQTLMLTGGNKAKAARLLKIDYKTIHTKVRKFGIQIDGGGNGKAQVGTRRTRWQLGTTSGRISKSA